MLSYHFNMLSNTLLSVERGNSDNYRDNKKSGKKALIVFIYKLFVKISSLIRLPFIMLSVLLHHSYSVVFKL